MDAERLKRIEEIYHAALELSPAKREFFFKIKCGEDLALRREVESLLAFEKPFDSFIDTPPESLAAEMFYGGEEYVCRVDQKIGHYSIKKLLGRGGMGEVYLAEDARLNRRVALKFLTGTISDDKKRLHRFKREVLAASALNHPNILTIYEFGVENETHFIAAEFVEGRTLREILNGGKLILKDILKIAEQTAFALAAAHKAGIIHRDIKPENIMVREDRIIKVLDFGLAKLIKPELPEKQVGSPPESGFGAKTVSSENTNSSGILGTVAYMSPEQTRGSADIDERTDIWSLGVVLYEMLMGKTPFAGETNSDLIEAILLKNPQMSGLNVPKISPELRFIVEKTLRQKREERYQNVGELLDDLRNLQSDLEFQSKLDSSAPPHSTGETLIKNTVSQQTLNETAEPYPNLTAEEIFPIRGPASLNAGRQFRTRAALPALLALSVMLAFAAFFLNKYFHRESGEKIPRPVPEPMKQTRLTTLGRVSDSAISPDGQFFAYVAKDGTKSALYARQTATNNTVTILPPSEAYYGKLSFSPDGEYIYFHSNNGKTAINDLYRVETAGGTPRKLIADVDSAVSFAPGGREFCFRRNLPANQESTIFIADADGTNERKIASRKMPDSFVSTPVWSPDGKTIAALIDDAVEGSEQFALLAINLANGEQKHIGRKLWNWVKEVTWIPDGGELLLIAQEKTGAPHQIMRVTFPGGEVSKITDDFNDYQGVSVTADGAALVTIKNSVTANLFVSPFNDIKNARQLTFVDGVTFHGLGWAPGGRIVYSSSFQGNRDIWLINSDGSNQRQLTSDAFINYAPVFTPDGRYIVYVSSRAGKKNIWRMNSDGSNPVQITGGTDGPGEFNPSVTPDGRWVVYDSTVSNESGSCIWKVPIDGGEPVKLTERESHFPKVSPNGKYVAFDFWSGGDTTSTISIVPITGGAREYNFSGVKDPWGWADSRALIYVDSTPGYSNIVRLNIKDGSLTQMTDFKSEQIFALELSRDGSRLAFIRGKLTSDAVMISNFR